MQMFFRCPEEGSFIEMQSQLSNVDGLVSVAKMPGDGLRDQGLAEFTTQEAAELAIDVIEKAGGEVIAAPGENKAKRGAKKEKNSALAKFFGEGASYEEQKRRKNREAAEALKTAEGQKNGSGRRGDNNKQGRARSASKGRGRGRQGGRGGRGGRGGGRGGRGRGRGFIMPQFVEGHVASINNVPVSMTNDQIAECFANCGTIFDIARYETLAMVYFDTADSVLEAICTANGKPMNGSVVTVSDGGVLRVPIPHLPPHQQLPLVAQ